MEFVEQSYSDMKVSAQEVIMGKDLGPVPNEN